MADSVFLARKHEGVNFRNFYFQTPFFSGSIGFCGFTKDESFRSCSINFPNGSSLVGSSGLYALYKILIDDIQFVSEPYKNSMNIDNGFHLKGYKKDTVKLNFQWTLNGDQPQFQSPSFPGYLWQFEKQEKPELSPLYILGPDTLSVIIPYDHLPPLTQTPEELMATAEGRETYICHENRRIAYRGLHIAYDSQNEENGLPKLLWAASMGHDEFLYASTMCPDGFPFPVHSIVRPLEREVIIFNDGTAEKIVCQRMAHENIEPSYPFSKKPDLLESVALQRMDPNRDRQILLAEKIPVLLTEARDQLRKIYPASKKKQNNLSGNMGFLLSGM